MIVARRPFPRIPRHFRSETSASIPKVPWSMFSDPPLPNSIPCHTSAKFTRKSFRCHTYKFALLQVLSLPHIQKTGGCPPLGVRRSCRRFRSRPLSAPISHVGESRYHITSVSHLTNLISFTSLYNGVH